MLSGLTKVCFSYFLSICVHNQKLLYKHVTIASQSLIPISLLTVTLRFDESFLSEHSKTRNVDCWQRLCGKPMNMTLIFPKLIKRDSWEDKKTKDVTRCSSVQFRLLSLALCRCLSRWAWLAWRLLSRFLCLSLSLYSKLEDIMNENSRKYEWSSQASQNMFRRSGRSYGNQALCLTKRGDHSFSRQKNLVPRIQNSHCTHRLPQIFHWYACGADGQLFVVRSRDYQIFWDG